MAALGLPFVNVTFEELALSAIARNERGVVALVLEDATAQAGITLVKSFKDIPETLSDKNKDLINQALVGGTAMADRLYVSVVATGDTLVGVEALENYFFSYLATPYATTEDKTSIVTFVEQMRINGSPAKYVVANLNADKPFVINFTTGSIVTRTKSYTTDEFTARIAGLLAGTPLEIATTYQPLPELVSVQKYTKDQLNEAIGKGEFVIFHDGRKVKVARGVTSLVTTSQAVPNSFKKIKVLAIADVIRTDISKTIDDDYIGKYANSYDNKILIVTAIRGYLNILARESLLDGANENTCEIDIEAQRLYLQSIGIETDSMSDQAVKMANTHDKLYLVIRTKILDAIEEVEIVVNI